jgi:hypothetical protein
MYPSLLKPADYLICLSCAKEAHAAAGTLPPADLYEWPIFDDCSSCSRNTQLLPARLFGVGTPSPTARKFALAVKGTLYQLAGWGHTIQAARARHESGNYWVEIMPRAGVTIRLAATRSWNKVIGRFVQAVGQLDPQIVL